MEHTPTWRQDPRGLFLSEGQGTKSKGKAFTFRLPPEYEEELLRLVEEGEIPSVSGFVRSLVMSALDARK